jgi:hypothetical protein
MILTGSFPPTMSSGLAGACADYLGHPDLGGKTLLHMVDGLYGG